MFKWLFADRPAAVLTRRAVLATASALAAVAVDTGLLHDAVGRAVVRALGALFGS